MVPPAARGPLSVLVCPIDAGEWCYRRGSLYGVRPTKLRALFYPDLELKSIDRPLSRVLARL